MPLNQILLLLHSTKSRTMPVIQGLFLFPLLLSTVFAFGRFPLSGQNSFLTLKSTTSSENIQNYYEMLECAETTKSSFAGKSVLLTGASGGLGKAFARNLASCQVDTLILSGRKKDALDTVAKECQELAPSVKIHIVTCDLADRDSVKKLGEEALSLCGGTVDVLVNNGGVSSRSNFLDTKLDVDERVMQINFLAGASLAKALVPNMVANNSGKIIWISSVQGLLGIPSRTSYAASKFAVQGYCEGLRAELAGNNVTVHVPSPGYIRTGLSLAALTGDGKSHGKMDETTAKGSEPGEVAVNILDTVAKGKGDFIVAAGASAKAAIWMRLLCPSILQTLLVKRFQKDNNQKEKDE
jgi:dehydrogenase/reductase SDR family protein 7B